MNFPGFPEGGDPGWWRIVTTTPPASEPVSVAEAKAWAIIPHSDDDAMVGDIIQAVREYCEGALGRAFITQGKTLYFMGFPWSGYFSLAIRGMGLNPWWFPGAPGIIQLPYPPLQTVTSIKYLDVNGTLQTLDPAQYVTTPNATPGRVQPLYGSTWPVARPQIDAVQIAYTCGYGDTAASVPASVRLAMRSMIAATYGNRDAFVQGGKIEVTSLFERLLNTERWGHYG